MKTDFWASGNHFLPFFLNSSQLLLLEAVFHLTRTYWKRGFYLFCLLFHSKFFSVSGNQGAVHFLKTSHIPASRHQFFQFFQKFFKVEATFPCSENVFLMGFQPSGKSIGQCYFTASRNHYWYKEKTVLRERAHYCQWTTDFLAGGNHFISIFQRFLQVIIYFPSSRSVFFNEILHSDQWKLICWLMETVFFSSEVFPSIGNRQLNWSKPIFKERSYFNQCN